MLVVVVAAAADCCGGGGLLRRRRIVAAATALSSCWKQSIGCYCHERWVHCRVLHIEATWLSNDFHITKGECLSVATVVVAVAAMLVAFVAAWRCLVRRVVVVGPGVVVTAMLGGDGFVVAVAAMLLLPRVGVER
jgi:hypothetical protein